MANTVDERIVEAKFDASDFEKGVDKTVKKLDELKKSLNIKEDGKSITDFAKQTTESVDKAGKSLEKLGERFTTFRGMIKQRILGGFADEVAGVFMNIERSVAGFIRTLSSDQVGAGLNKYTEILNSVRTMTAAGIAEDVAYDKIKRLAEYSDQTSYSLDQMTSGMSKLVAAGMDVDKAEKSMEGLANMCASAGVNIYEAQRAFLNFSQAYSSGKMRINDWMSFESLNMATENIMKVFMQAGEQVGTLQKTVDKNGKEVYKTLKTVNKEVKAGKEVTTQGFRDTLNYGWLDKKTMEQATAVLSYFEDLGISVNDLTEDQLQNFAATAFQAAKEARSFSDVMGTLKDVIATGWATSFEHIFGQLSEAKEFFTWLTESDLANAIYAIGEFRNDMLKAWGEAYAGEDENGDLEGGLFKAGKTGRDSLMESLRNIDAMVGAVTNSLAKLSPQMYNETLGRYLTFPEMLGLKLGYMTRDFMHATEAVLDFFTVMEKQEDGTEIRVLKPEYLERLSKITTGLQHIFGVLGKALGAIGDTISKVVVRIQPIIDAIVSAFGKLMEPFADLNTSSNVFDKFGEAVDNFLTVIQPILNVLPPVIELLGEIGKFFVDNALGIFSMNVQLVADALGFLIELFGGQSAQQAKEGIGVIEGMKNDLIAFGDACKDAYKSIETFFKALFEDLRDLLGLGEQTEGEEGGFFKNIQDFFTTDEFAHNVKYWLQNVALDIAKWIRELPDHIAAGISTIKNFAKNLWNKIDEFLFGKKVKYTWKGKEMTGRLKNGFSLWLDQASKKVINWFKSIPQKAKDIWNAIDEFLFGKKIQNNLGNGQVETTRVKEGFSKWLDQAVADVKTFFTTTIPTKANEIWNNVMKFFFGENIEITEADGSTKTEHVESEFSKWFTDTRTRIENWAKGIPDEVAGTWDQIVNFFFGTPTESYTGTIDADTKTNANGTRVLSGFSLWLNTTIESVKEWSKDIPTKVRGMWNTVLDALFGNEEFDQNEYNKLFAQSPIGAEQYLKKTQKNSIVENVQNTLKDLGIDIAQEIQNLPANIVKGWNFTTNLVGDLLEKATSFLNKKNQNRELVQNSGQSAKDLMKDMADEMVKESNGNDLMKVLSDFGADLGALIGTTIPAFLSEAWTFISAEGANLWTTIEGIFEDNGITWTNIDAKAREIGENIGNAIKTIPGHIRNAAAVIKEFFRAKSPFDEFKAELDSQFEKGLINENQYRNALSTAEKEISKQTPKSGLWEGIKDIGKSLGEAFQDIGPDILDGLGKGLDWLSGNFNQVTEFLKGIPENLTITDVLDEQLVNEDQEPNKLWESIKSIGQKIFDFITVTIPAFVTAAVQQVSKEIPNILSGLFGGKDDHQTVDDATNAVEGTAEKAVEAATEAVERLKLKQSENIDKTQKDSGQDIVGSILGWLIPSASAEDAIESEIEQNTKKQLANREQLIKEYEQKRDELMNKLYDFKLPQGERSVYSNELKDVMNRLKELNSVEDEMVEITTKDTNIEKAEDKLGKGNGFFGDLIKIFNDLSKSNILTAAAIIIGLGFMLQKIVDLFSISDEMEAIGYDALMVAVELAVGALVGILGWTAYLVMSGNDTQLQAAYDLFDKLLGFLERLGEVIEGIIALWVVSKGIGAVGDIFGKTGEKGSIITTLLKGAAEVGLIVAGGERLGDAIEGGIGGIFGGLADAFGSMGSGIEEAIGSIIPAVNELAEFNGNIDIAVDSVDKTFKLLGKFKDIAVGEVVDNVLGKISLDEALTKSTEFFTRVGSAVQGLGLGLSNFDPEKATNEKMEALSRLVSGEGFEHLIQNLTKMLRFNISGGDNAYMNAATMISGVLTLFGTGVADLDYDKLDIMDQFFGKLVNIFMDENKQFDVNKITRMGTALRRFGTGFSDFMERLKKVREQIGDNQEKDWVAYEEAIDLAVRAAQGMAIAASQIGGIESVSNFKKLINALSNMGGQLAQFILGFDDIIGPEMGADRMKAISSVIQAIGDLMYGAGSIMGRAGIVPEDMPGYISQFFIAMTESLNSDNGLQSLALAAGQTLDSGFAEGVGEDKSVTAVQSMVDRIKTILDGLNNYEIKDFTPKITPVVDWSNYNGNDQNGNGLPVTATPTFSRESLITNAQAANPDNKYVDYSSIVSAIEGVRSAVESLDSGETTARVDLSGVGINLNASELADQLIGYIDIKLGKEGYHGGREG